MYESDQTTTSVRSASNAPQRRVMVVFGTRPEAIKMAPVVRQLASSPLLQPIVAVTAQHREMLDQVLELFAIVPDHDLNIIQPRQSLTQVTTRALEGLSALVEKVRPDAVAVQGDTTTTLAGALAGFYQQVPVVHLEAGLRTTDVSSPFPEEINRRLTTQLASLHLAATPWAKSNLLAEGVSEQQVLVTGNTVIDALIDTASRPVPFGDPALDGLESDERRVLLVTAHRRESWGAGMASIGRALRLLADDPGLLVVFPMHRNPVVREAIVPAVAGCHNILLVEPLSYGPFVHLMRRADVILTDSGGVQEEGPSLGKPVLVMRDTTERPEAVHAGVARLVGTDTARIVASVRQLLDEPEAYARMANAVNPYGDGRAAQRTVDAIAHLLGLGSRPKEFKPELPSADGVAWPPSPLSVRSAGALSSS